MVEQGASRSAVLASSGDDGRSKRSWCSRWSRSAWYLFVRNPRSRLRKRDWVVVGNLKNLTGETSFDDSLETAFRIGLEQSRYVNVLPDLKMRDTVKRMQRDPDQTESIARSARKSRSATAHVR